MKYGEDSPYMYGVITEWKDEDKFQEALKAEATKAIMDDVPNYTDGHPIIAKGEVVGSG
jgi:quinol monooxygenase YgiN